MKKPVQTAKLAVLAKYPNAKVHLTEPASHYPYELLVNEASPAFALGKTPGDAWIDAMTSSVFGFDSAEDFRYYCRTGVKREPITD